MRLEAIPPWLSPMLLTPCSIWIGIGAALRDHAGLFGTAIAQDNLLTVTVPAQRPLPYFGPNSKLSVERCFGRMRRHRAGHNEPLRGVAAGRVAQADHGPVVPDIAGPRLGQRHIDLGQRLLSRIRVDGGLTMRGSPWISCPVRQLRFYLSPCGSP